MHATSFGALYRLTLGMICLMALSLAATQGSRAKADAAKGDDRLGQAIKLAPELAPRALPGLSSCA